MYKVGLFIESSRASGRALLLGVSRYVHTHEDWSFHWEPGGLERIWSGGTGRQLDGVLLRDVTMLDEILSLKIPAVVIGHSRGEVPGLVNVATDSERIGRLAAEHLVDCGFRNFGFCGFQHDSKQDTSWSDVRYQHFRKRLLALGFQEPAAYTFSMARMGLVSGIGPSEVQSLASWLESLPKPVGLLACNDDCGWLVMEACAEAQLEVPDMVGVVGADNDEVVCGLSKPPLSSVAIDFAHAGYEAAQALDNLMKGNKRVPGRIQVAATHVVPRRSTDFVAVPRSELARALRFIRDYARLPMRVGDVAQAAGVSRRALEKYFREDLGRTVMQEIRRVRTDRIAQLLVETNLSISQIADMLDFQDVQHFARYFRAVKKMSPRAYRNEFSRM